MVKKIKLDKLPSYEYDVAFSFASEDDKYVKKVAEALGKTDIRIFYSNNEVSNLWGKDLYTYLDDVFRKKAKYSVLFFSKYYAKSLWTNRERRSAQARAFSENKEYILPARFDNTEIDGLEQTISYVNLKKIAPKEFAQLVKEKIGIIYRENFIPNNIDNLFKELKIKNSKEKIVAGAAMHFLFKTLTLMSRIEREMLWIALKNGCAAGEPDNIHLYLELYKRLTNKTEEEIIFIFSRLNFLDIKSKIHAEKYKHEKDDIIPNSKQKIEIKFKPMFITNKQNLRGKSNSTYVLYAIYNLLSKNSCKICRKEAFLRLDFSVLNINSAKEKS